MLSLLVFDLVVDLAILFVIALLWPVIGARVRYALRAWLGVNALANRVATVEDQAFDHDEDYSDDGEFAREEEEVFLPAKERGRS